MKFLKERDFESILAIVKSDLYKANKARFGRLEDVPDDYITALTELKGELMTYMSYLEIPEDQEDEDYYY